MLEKIEVNGFRSLRNFALELVPGLNILVGPNGAGKTNIITFFEFISHICDGDISDAVHKVGGVASVLHRDASGAYPAIAFTISGTTSTYSSGSDETRYVRYEYSGVVKVSEELSDIFFSSQSLRILNSRNRYEVEDIKRPVRWDLEVSAESSGRLEGSTLNVDRIDLRKASVLTGIRFRAEGYDIRTFIRKNLRGERIFRHSLLLLLDSAFSNVRSIRNDLKSGEVYNIYPGAVKSREDISTPVGVQPDGSGTSATLLALSRLSSRAAPFPEAPIGIHRPKFRLVPSAYIDIVKMLKLVNDSVDDMIVSIGQVDGFINTIFKIRTDAGEIDVPLQRMSDGTVKWLALITAIRTNRVMFAIEEPENYLHPYMQKEIIGIIRNSFANGRNRGFALVSTHSETLLNAVYPEEIIVVSMQNGGTVARRPDDVRQISEVISETGFGLGTIYVGGGLEGA
jgi:predicted ATPase